MIKLFFTTAIASILSLGCSPLKQIEAQEPIFFTQVDVFDGEKKIESTNVLITKGKIQAMGKDIKAPENAATVDGTGKTLMPGMIDSHTHCWTEADLVQAAIFGVTTELDMMGSPSVGIMLRGQQKDGEANDRADYFSAGSAVTVKDGHGTQFGLTVPTLDRVEDTDQFVNERVREGSDYIKLIHEDGSAYGFSRPTLSKEMFAAAVKAAHRNEKLAVAHVSTQSGAKMAFESGIDGLVHLFADEEMTPDLLSIAQAKSVFVAPTASIISNTVGENRSQALSNDKNLLPLLTDENLYAIAQTYPEMPNAKGTWAKFKNNISKLNKAGIPILAGTDSPNPGTTHGLSMHMELRLLVEAGLTNQQALAAATSVPAKHFSLTDRGRISRGLRADLILVEGDPTEDVKNVARIVGVWKGGHAIDRQSRIDSVAAKKEAKANPTAVIGNLMISDFDGSGKKISASFGAGWSQSTDSLMGGNSTAKMELVDGGANNSKSSMKVTGKTRAQQPAFAGAMFAPGGAMMQPGDISAHQGISFWAKGSGEEFQIMFFFQKRGMFPSTKTFKAEKEWKKYEFNIADFDKCDGTDVLGIWFGNSTPGEFEFQIDQVELIK